MPSDPTTLGSPWPTSPEGQRGIDTTADVAGLRVVSGTGEELGRAIEIVRDRYGSPKWVTFQETPGSPQRRVKLEFVKSVGSGAIRLAGPREGFHITRVG